MTRWKTLAKLSATCWPTSATLHEPPDSATIDVICTASIPQGTIRLKSESSVLTFKAKPWNVTQRVTWTPIEAIFLPRTQTPVKPGKRVPPMP